MFGCKFTWPVLAPKTGLSDATEAKTWALVTDAEAASEDASTLASKLHILFHSAC